MYQNNLIQTRPVSCCERKKTGTFRFSCRCC